MNKINKVLGMLGIALLLTIPSSCDINNSNSTNTKLEQNKKYSVVFDNNGHGKSIENSMLVTAIPNELPELSEEGYIFAGWYTDMNMENKAIPNDNIDKNVTLYAKWLNASIDNEMMKYIDDLISKTTSFIPAWNMESFKGKWNYIDGVFLNSIVNLYYDLKDTEVLKADTYKSFFLNYIDYYLSDNGSFKNLKNETESGYIEGELDSVCESKILFDAYQMTNNQKYLNAIQNTYQALMNQPRVSDSNNFAHKTSYQNQIWLDGLYMYAPFYARYALATNSSNIFDEIKGQYKYVREHMYNEKDQLYYHGYDSTKTIFWASKDTGCSSNYWLRSMGWYIVSLADVIEYFPDGSTKDYLIGLLNEAINGIMKYQDYDSKMFYQIINLGSEKVLVKSNYLNKLKNTKYFLNGGYSDTYISNYLESSGSSMIAYALMKSAHKGYIDSNNYEKGKELFKGIYLHSYYNSALGDICITAGLGPDNKLYRDGSEAYYLAEPIGKNDAKGVGPFLMAFLEYDYSTVNIPTPVIKISK